jgi:nicotinate dehydrogenase subunit A
MSQPSKTADKRFALNVNGASAVLDIPANTSLLEALRHDLDLKGTRIGCAQGNCGACTVLIDDRPFQSCVTSIDTVENCDVVTIEGLKDDAAFNRVRQTFLDEQAAQCGYCINGILMTLTGLLKRAERPELTEVLRLLDERHLCRCGAHSRILRAIDRILGEHRQ